MAALWPGRHDSKVLVQEEEVMAVNLLDLNSLPVRPAFPPNALPESTPPGVFLVPNQWKHECMDSFFLVLTQPMRIRLYMLNPE